MNNARQQTIYNFINTLSQWPEDKKAIEFIKLLNETSVSDTTLELAVFYTQELFRRDEKSTFKVKTDFHGRVLCEGTLEDCLKEVNNFYTSDCIDTITLYKYGKPYAYISRLNPYEAVFTLNLVGGNNE